eukprot:CAMPEP_0194563794 /NCGR_PEP_ID=MMETSP0292-20121207/3711_1 /TAXON_ID=39354 /ORGANISM="Heterosigma akashiwo, Strain CCMP2393" /LENGTH=54 /DNA_ID=CAMNT_0039412803 /DNA_START=220 /DNA_END=380 /DNA_ORIENTATION=-
MTWEPHPRPSPLKAQALQAQAQKHWAGRAPAPLMGNLLPPGVASHHHYQRHLGP